MTEFSAGTIRKRRNRGGDWEWFGQFSYVRDGKQVRLSKGLGVACDPLTDEEKKMGRKFVPGGKGAKLATSRFKAWRKSAIGKIESQDERDALPDPATLPVPQYVSYYLDNRRDHERSTQLTMVSNKKHLESDCLRVPMCDLTTEDVETWLKELDEKGLGAVTRLRVYGLLKSACKYAVRARHIKLNPMEPIEPPKTVKHQPNPLDDANLAIMNTVLDDIDKSNPLRWRITNGSRIALLSGMRVGEICGLRWKDVSGWKSGQFDGGTILVSNVIARSSSGFYNKSTPKNGHERSVPISGQLAEVLRVCRLRLAEECIQEGVPFTGELYVLGKAVPEGAHGTGFQSPMYLSVAWTQIVRNSPVWGIRGGKPVFHDLRHTFATHAIASGLDVVTVAAILGHSDPSLTLRIYSDYLPTKGQEAMAMMGELLSKRKEPAKVVELPTGTDN